MTAANYVNVLSAGPEPSDHPPVTPTCPSLPSLSVFLLSHPGLGRHNHAADSLALYLQAFCACNVTYFRWHLDDIRFVGPEAWAVEQIELADCVIFVHSPETKDCYEAWKTMQLKENESDMVTRMLTTVFDYTAKNTRRRWFSVTFHSDLSAVSDSSILVTRLHTSLKETQTALDCSAGSETNRNAAGTEVPCSPEISPAGTEDSPERTATGSRDTPDSLKTISAGTEGSPTRTETGSHGTPRSSETRSAGSEDSPARTATGSHCTPRSSETSSSGTHVYRLMNDFSQLLADLHNLPNNPKVLRGCDLPIDSDHLDTQEGRQLYKAVAFLRQCCQAGGRECSGACVRGDDGHVCKKFVQRLDSGFDEYSISFICPEELSVEDAEDISLGDRFRDINARYEKNLEDSASLCYTLGGRYA